MKRPGSLTIVSLFYWLNALGLGAIGLVALLSSVRSQVSEDLRSVLLLGSLLVGIIALTIFVAVVGWGLWQLRAWARRAAIVMSSLAIAINLIIFVIGFMNRQFSIPYGIVLYGAVLWVLNKVSIKAIFDATATGVVQAKDEAA